MGGAAVTRELLVKGHADLMTGEPEKIRSVYLVAIEGGAEHCELWEVDLSLTKARDLVAWALSLGIRVKCHPPECLRENYAWPLPGWRPAYVSALPPLE